MAGRRVFLTGGSGFIGTHVVNKLVAAGDRVLVPTRRYDRAKHLAVMPGVEVVEVKTLDEKVLRQLLKGCHAVINLVGIAHGRTGEPAVYGPDFAYAHVELPKRIADVAVALGIRRFIHMSALGVKADGKRTLPSRYLRSRAAGEQSLRSMYNLDLTILRPSVVFGREDRFLNLFTELLGLAPLLTLPRPQTRFSPVWVEDVAKAVVVCLDRPSTIGKTFELVGPETFTLRQLVENCARWSGNRKPIIGLPDALGRLQAFAIEMMPGPPLMSRDNFDSMTIDNVSSVGWPAELGFEPHALSSIVPKYLSPQSRIPLSLLRARARR